MKRDYNDITAGNTAKNEKSSKLKIMKKESEGTEEIGQEKSPMIKISNLFKE